MSNDKPKPKLHWCHAGGLGIKQAMRIEGNGDFVLLLAEGTLDDKYICIGIPINTCPFCSKPLTQLGRTLVGRHFVGEGLKGD